MPPIPRSSAVLTLAVMLPAAAPAHKAPSGWHYDGWCCGGLDCQPIPAEQVDITDEGFVVTIPADRHVTARRPHRKLFRYGEERRSGDQNYHACIIPSSQEFRCLYVPPFGY